MTQQGSSSDISVRDLAERLNVSQLEIIAAAVSIATEASDKDRYPTDEDFVLTEYEAAEIEKRVR